MPDFDASGSDSLDIAIVGMAGRFPSAPNLEQFWRNLRDGRESITFFSDQEARASGADAGQLRNPHYVKAGGVLEGAELFDAAFFGYYPREAEILDPQQRVFLECAWEALENAGCDPERYAGPIGVWAGCGLNSYLLNHLLRNSRIAEGVEAYHLTVGNDKDFLPTRVSYKLNLRGPSVNVQTACSTSLVAVHLACQALLGYQCDMALAGGVAIRPPQKRGYLYQEGGILSPDGHCRAFDERAGGTVPGNGVGVVVLKRLADALADGDSIRAVIKGTAINNDGSQKVGFTAPSVDGQAAVITAAQALAGVDPETIGYVEAHGTGTALGDPVEIAALTQAFGGSRGGRAFCAIGSLKTNVGHLDAAAGVAGLIKTVLALEHKLLPPSLNFSRPNPRAGFEDSPFYVNAALKEWSGGRPRRAGVSSFGLGGTNAHAVLEEAPRVEPSGPARSWQLVTLSARTPAALDASTAGLAAHFRANPELDFADAVFTLHLGRRQFNCRRFAVCSGAADAAAALESRDSARVVTGTAAESAPPVAFLFSGQGSQHIRMAEGLYREEPVFREELRRCAGILEPHLGLNLCDALYPPAGREEEAARRLDETWLTQPVLFAVEYALARLWMHWGVKPQAMIGHSIGEYVAACLAGVFPLEDALRLVAARGQLMQSLPAGAMLSVSLPAAAVEPALGPDLSLAAENAPDLCVVSGPAGAVAGLRRKLENENTACRLLHTSHAFHSAMMDPILEEFEAQVAATRRREPDLPFVSNRSGTWITAGEAVDPRYWAGHLRGTVRFAAGVAELLKEDGRAMLEIGPGSTLASLVRRQGERARHRVVVNSLPHPREPRADIPVLLHALGRLWQAGVEIGWNAFHAGERRLKVPLPAYSFERKRYWVEPDRATRAGARSAGKREEVESWFYQPSWKRKERVFPPHRPEPARWLVAGGASARTARIAAGLRESGHELIPLEGPAGECDPVLAGLAASGCLPGRVLFVPEREGTQGFHRLLMLVQALVRRAPAARLEIAVVTSGACEVTGEEELNPFQALTSGLCRVIPQEYPNISCRNIDLDGCESLDDKLFDRLTRDLEAGQEDPIAALRAGRRWVPAFEPLAVHDTPKPPAVLRANGVYLITGGLGRIGVVLAGYLARTVQARLALLDRMALEAGSDRERQVKALESQAAGVLTLQADVADEDSMRAAIAGVEQRFGRLHGVFHLAGITEQGAVSPIPETSREACERQFRPKVLGSLVLERLLRDKDLDFCLLQSSLSSILGGLGFGVYAGANAFVDAFAQKQFRVSRFPWISVNWDGWRFGESLPGAPAAAVELAMTPEEGERAFGYALALRGFPQVIISTADLAARVEKWSRPDGEAGEQPTERAGDYERPALATGFVAPRNETEESIAAEWRRVLGIEQIGVEDNFFELGGHSLLGTQLVSRLRDKFQVDLPLRRLFETPTVGGLAALVEEVRGGSGKTQAPGLRRIPREGRLALSFGQQRLWFLDQLEPGSPLYNNAAAVRLRGAVDVPVLERALNEIVRRHEALRTVFLPEEGQPAQVILAELKLALPVEDLRGLALSEQAARVRLRAMEYATQPFDLARGPLLRFGLLRLAEDEYAGLLTMHHIVSDGWSTGVLMSELAVLYEAFARSADSPLPELEVQYADFARWQREWLAGERLASQVEYWKRQLRDLPPFLDLCAGRARPALQSFRGETRWFPLPDGMLAELQALSRKHDATLFMTLLAAFQVLLWRYTGQNDFAVGTPVAGRNQAAIEPLIGFFVNTLVVRAGLAGDPAFTGLLGRVRETCLGAYAHPDLPFEMLVEELQPERDLSRTPLFQVMFVLQDAPLRLDNIPGLEITRLETDSGTAKFDLTMFVEQDRDQLRLGLNYCSDLFGEDTVARMAGHYRTLLEGILAEPERPLSQLPLLTAAERRLIVEEWNSLTTAGGGFVPAGTLFEERARRSPQAPALVFGTESISYAELNARANRLARYLADRGAGPETIVGVSVGRSPEMVVALLGILKCGGAFLPLDPELPRERLAFMIQDAGARLVLTRKALMDALPDQAECVCLDSDWDRIAAASPLDVPSQVFPENVAYVIFTSGSTGRPKGVAITHGAFARHCREVAAHFGLSAEDRELQFASINFDAGLEQILPPLIAGATLYVRDALWSARDFHRRIAGERLTVVNVPPGYWEQWVHELERSSDLGRPEHLRLVIIGGDLLRPEVLKAWQASPLGPVRLLNAYGPTETTITAATFEVRAGAVPERVPIGRPLANRSAYILDPSGNPVPAGVPGELHLGGLGLARGYLNRPELTAERFIPDPFSTQPGARLYRTGDLARFLAGGAIEFLGRLDEQVKVRGFRIELGEIEAALARHPEVKQAVVTVREDVAGDKRLVAYVLPRDGEAPEGLAEFLKGRLPGYMLPSDFVTLQAFPLTPGGKVDRRALPAPQGGRAAVRSAYRAPRTPLESELAAIWAQVLNVERVGIDDNFFDLRGHSLLAARLLSRVREAFHVELPLRSVFLEPTVAGMSAAIAQARAGQENRDELERLLAEIERLSDREARSLLSKETQ
ncbi:MAG: amino acid adenylation domain-containing protein [Bryobacterales bacterium]|nr:amino acid adenylation domain-containing protein [Bryobacterales bacterium]